MRKTVALVGASSTGKTTVYDLLKHRLGEYSHKDETSRFVNSYGFPINMDATNESHLAISSKHLEDLTTPGNLLLDRCYMDLMVYSKFTDKLTVSTHNFIEDTWNRIKDKYTHYIYFPIEGTAQDDGVRNTDETIRAQVDEEFKALLEGTRKPYLTVSGTPMVRMYQILNYIE